MYGGTLLTTMVGNAWCSYLQGHRGSACADSFAMARLLWLGSLSYAACTLLQGPDPLLGMGAAASAAQALAAQHCAQSRPACSNAATSRMDFDAVRCELFTPGHASSAPLWPFQASCRAVSCRHCPIVSQGPLSSSPTCAMQVTVTVTKHPCFVAQRVHKDTNVVAACAGHVTGCFTALQDSRNWQQ